MSQANKNTIVDISKLYKQLGGKKDKIKAILHLFIEHTPPSIVEIRQLLDQRQWSDLRNKVHSIKSYYGYLGNNNLLQRLEEWEQGLVTSPDDYNHFAIMLDLESNTPLIVDALKEIIQSDLS